MSWRDEPATSPQLSAIRDLYWKGSDYVTAMAYVQELKRKKITKGEASKIIDQLKDMKAHGQLHGNI